MKYKNGQALVEFALVLPLFLLIIIGGIIDFGLSINNKITLQNLAGDIAKWGALNHKTNEEINNYFISQNKSNLHCQLSKIERIKLNNGGNAIKIVISYENPMLTPFYQILLEKIVDKQSITIKAIAVYKEPEYIK